MSSAPRAQDVVAAGYDAVAERYADWQARIRGDPRGRYVELLLAALPERPDILELGCGAGVEPTPTLAARGHLIGIDVSAAQIARARVAVPAGRFVHGDATRVELPAASFDAVVALYVLTHVPTGELPALLRRIARWLRPGGVLLATFGAGERHDTFVEDWLGAPTFFAGLPVAENERLVRDAGLTVLESRVEEQREPSDEPGRGEEIAAFHWVFAGSEGPLP